MPKLMKKQNASKEKKKKKKKERRQAKLAEKNTINRLLRKQNVAKDFFLAAQKSPAVLKYIWTGLKVWLWLFFKIFFTHKYIKIIYFFKLFLISTYQNDLKTLKKYKFEEKK